MGDYNDKSETVEFNPIKDEKKHINRSDEDIYSSARRSKDVSYEEKSESSDKKLVYIAIILTVLLAASIIAGAIILTSDNKEKNAEELPEDNIITEQEPPAVQEEEEKEPEEVIKSYSIVFYSDSVIKKDGEYTILADLYNSNFEKVDNRKLTINGDTDIRENGKKLSAQGLIYAVESLAGDGIVFEGKIKEPDNVAVSIYYEGSFREEVESMEESEAEEENPPEEAPPEESEQIPPESKDDVSNEEPVLPPENSGEEEAAQ